MCLQLYRRGQILRGYNDTSCRPSPRLCQDSGSGPPRSGPNYFIIRPWENIAEHYGGSPPPPVKVSTEFHDNFYTIRRRLLVESAWHLNKVSPSEIELGHLSDNLNASGQVFQFQVKRLHLNRFLSGKALVGTFNK